MSVTAAGECSVGCALAAVGVRVRLRGLVRRVASQLAGRAARVLDRGDGVFEDQLLLRAGFEEDGELVEALDAPLQLRAAHQIDRDAAPLAPRRVQERVLNVLRGGLAVHGNSPNCEGETR